MIRLFVFIIIQNRADRRALCILRLEDGRGLIDKRLIMIKLRWGMVYHAIHWKGINAYLYEGIL